ncbi:hypothetical protein N7492_000489 [Penicillium capsulatum]|uniref:Uncharacterized protein n=1 Tax=Penicillium capsulatum TaxID=69766 RepID=A0A9W9LYS7_9EURO|nr:hypothetical protein N7492_000489 [Penicillium capsulatum]KAJ6130452.1 hypothetical protein N7512_003232 [Penicillium capsulatum]
MASLRILLEMSPNLLQSRSPFAPRRAFRHFPKPGCEPPSKRLANLSLEQSTFLIELDVQKVPKDGMQEKSLSRQDDTPPELLSVRTKWAMQSPFKDGMKAKCIIPRRNNTSAES